MKNFQSGKKPGGFAGGSGYKGRSEGRGSFGGDRARSGGDRDFGQRGARPERSFSGANRSFDRPPMHDAVCSECGRDCQVPFRPTGAKPVFCSNCFAENNGGGNKSFDSRDFSRDHQVREAYPEKRMFKATCEECGERCEVPFKPVPGKSVFCDNCFHGNESPKKSPKSADNYQEQFTALNNKLDLILKALTAKESVKEPVKESVKAKELTEELEEAPVAVVKPVKSKAVKAVKTSSTAKKKTVKK